MKEQNREEKRGERKREERNYDKAIMLCRHILSSWSSVCHA